MKERLSERDRAWLAHLEAAEGMSLSQYATEHGLSVDVLYSAKSRLKCKEVLSAPSSRFTPVGRASRDCWRAGLRFATARWWR